MLKRTLTLKGLVKPWDNYSKHLALHTGPVQRRSISSSVDWKPVRSKKDVSGGGSKLILGLMMLMPVASFCLGTWQVRRLKWKADLIAKAENRLTLPPLPLPAGQLDAGAIDANFDYRRVIVEGTFVHEQEMLVGPRVHDGRVGHLVVTPLVRENGTKVLVVRGWIDEQHKEQSSRPMSLTKQKQKLICLLRRKPQKSTFTSDGHPMQGVYHFMDIDKMAELTQSQPVYIEALQDENNDLLPDQLIKRGIPLGATGKVEFRNSHFQYIMTWYGLFALTSVMLFYLIKQRRQARMSGLAKRIAHERKESS